MSASQASTKKRNFPWLWILIILGLVAGGIMLFAVQSYTGKCSGLSGVAWDCSFTGYLAEVVFFVIPLLLMFGAVLLVATPPGWLLLGIVLVAVVLIMRANRKPDAESARTLTPDAASAKLTDTKTSSAE